MMGSSTPKKQYSILKCIVDISMINGLPTTEERERERERKRERERE